MTKEAGINRFVWNVQHASGLTAPPGNYMVRLKVGTATLLQPLTVLIDPRVTLAGPGDVWKVSLWAKNASNNYYYREIFNDGGSVIGFPAAPRQIGLTYSYRWQ